MNYSQIPFDPRYADECTYQVEEDWAETKDHETEVIVIYLQTYWNGERSNESSEDRLLEKAFIYWGDGEVNHKEYKEYHKWLEEEAKKRAFKCL